MLRQIITPRAVRDTRAAAQWYRDINPVLKDRMLRDLRVTIQTAAERPGSFPEVEDGVRVAKCKRFPYRVYFEVAGDALRVLAVYHMSRDPDQWDEPDRT